MLIHVQIELQFQIQIKKIFRSNLRIIMTTSRLSLLRVHKIIIALVRSLSFRTSGSKFWRMLYLLGALPFSDVSLLLLNLILGKSEKFLARILVLVCPRLSPDHPYVRFFVGIATSIHAKLFSMSHCYHASNLNPPHHSHCLNPLAFCWPYYSKNRPGWNQKYQGQSYSRHPFAYFSAWSTFV